MKRFTIEVFPGVGNNGQSFNYIIYHEDGQLAAKGNLQGDMVHDRIVDVLSPHIRTMALELDGKLKQLRKENSK